MRPDESSNKLLPDHVGAAHELKVTQRKPTQLSGRKGPTPIQAQDQEIVNELTAPVLVPPRETLSVQLVPASDLERLEEYQADVTRFSGLAGLLAGFPGGILVNIVTGGVMTPAAWLVCVGSVLGLLLCEREVQILRRRAGRLKDKLRAAKDHKD